MEYVPELLKCQWWSRDWTTIDWRLSDCILAWRLGMDKRAIAEKRMAKQTEVYGEADIIELWEVAP